MRERTALARGYFALQGIAVIAWWAMLLFLPATRTAFAIRGAPPIALDAFAPGDLGLVAIGSLLVAAFTSRAWSGTLAWVVAGAMVYAALFTIATAITGASGPLGALLMMPAAIVSVGGASVLGRSAARP